MLESEEVIGCCIASGDNKVRFVSAEVTVTGGGNHVMVTLTSDGGYASISHEWLVIINDEPISILESNVSGKDTNMFKIVVGPNFTILPEDVVTVSHLVAASGISKFIKQPVVNNFNTYPE